VIAIFGDSVGKFMLQSRDSHFCGATALALARGLTRLEILRLPRRVRWLKTAFDKFVSSCGAAETLDAGSDFGVNHQKIPNHGIDLNFVTRSFRSDLRVIGRSNLRFFRVRKLDSGFSGHSPLYCGKSGVRLCVNEMSFALKVEPEEKTGNGAALIGRP
jgi:hypothetical protein